MVPPSPRGPLRSPITIPTQAPRGEAGRRARAGAGVRGFRVVQEHPAGEKGPESLATGPARRPGTAWLTAAWSQGHHSLTSRSLYKSDFKKRG